MLSKVLKINSTYFLLAAFNVDTRQIKLHM